MPKLETGDIIGCGINIIKRELFFTINGTFYGNMYICMYVYIYISLYILSINVYLYLIYIYSDTKVSPIELREYYPTVSLNS